MGKGHSILLGLLTFSGELLLSVTSATVQYCPWVESIISLEQLGEVNLVRST